jgi:RNA recognition motif-containing protein
MDMGNRLYVGNLPFDATEKQIRSFVEGEGRTVSSIKIVTDRDSGKSRGFAFVDLESADQVQKAISELNGKDFGGRALVVNEAQDKGPAKAGTGFRSAFSEKGHARDQAKGGFGSRGPMQQMPRGSTRGGGRGGTRGS